MPRLYNARIVKKLGSPAAAMVLVMDARMSVLVAEHRRKGQTTMELKARNGRGAAKGRRAQAQRRFADRYRLI